MMALTLHEPWATLIALGHKTIETRSWPTRYRGPIAIHAGKNEKFVREWEYLWYDANDGIPGLAPPPPASWPFGQIVAVADLIACLPAETMKPSAKDRAFGNFSPGRWGWQLANVRQVLPGIPARGFQMLWELPAEVAAEIARRS